MMFKIEKHIFATSTLALSIALAIGSTAYAAEDMSGMDHSKMGHQMPAAEPAGSMTTMDHSQMDKESAAQNQDMSGMDHSGGGSAQSMSMQGGAAPAGARDPHAYSGGYDFGSTTPHGMADEAYMGGLMVNQLESVTAREDSFNAYDIQGWFGKDYDRLVLKAEGESDEGKLHEARTELLWQHAIATFWNSQLGMRYDSGLAPARKWLALGVQGLAPYWFEVDVTAYLGDHGRSALRLGVEYELLITQKLILQPSLEVNVYGKSDLARDIGNGVSDAVTGLRLRYEFTRQFAPYVGVEWVKKFGDTANYARAAGDKTHEARGVAGVRFWF